MSKDKILSAATAAFEITKMVAIIAAHTTCKLISVGKTEIVKQFKEYKQNATPQQLEALNMFKDLTTKGTELAKSSLQQAKKQAMEKAKELPKKELPKKAIPNKGKK